MKNYSKFCQWHTQVGILTLAIYPMEFWIKNYYSVTVYKCILVNKQMGLYKYCLEQYKKYEAGHNDLQDSFTILYGYIF